MRIGYVGAVVAVGLPLALASGAQALPAAHGVHGMKPVVVRSGGGHKCRKTVINGINDHGTAIGTTYCGKAAAFVRTKSGKVTRYRLPRKRMRFTLASNISSNGILAVAGYHKLGGAVTSFLVAPSGQLTVLADPNGYRGTTVVNGVNRHGAAVGTYCIDKKCQTYRSFIERRGTYRDFVMTARRLLPNLSTITDSGALIGSFYQAPKGYSRGFIKAHGKVRVIDAPHASKKLGQGTDLWGGANHGAVCGESIARGRPSVGFVQFHGHRQLIKLHFSGSKPFTNVLACNSHGEIGGNFHRYKGNFGTGFLAKLG